MAITQAIIQMRRGRESEMVTSKFLPAEFGIATDTKKAYVAFAAGDVKRLSTYEDMSADMAASLADLEKEYLGQITEATQKALEARKEALSTIAAAEEAAKKADYAAQSILELCQERDLTAVFADEISKFPDAWSWIKNRIQSGNYCNIHVGDYIPIVVDNITLEMQVAGIDVYTGATDNNLGHHIDFISRDCFSMAYWNGSENNNGSADNPYPYIASDLKRWLEETLYISLPQEVKNQIVTKRALMEQRYSASESLTESIAWGWQDIGKLWVPSEYEVFGSCIWGTKGWSAGSAVQYPIFANTKNRIKHVETERYDWWLATTATGNDTNACSVNADGSPAGYFYTSNNFGVPVCFRIA